MLPILIKIQNYCQKSNWLMTKQKSPKILNMLLFKPTIHNVFIKPFIDCMNGTIQITVIGKDPFKEMKKNRLFHITNKVFMRLEDTNFLFRCAFNLNKFP